MLEFLIKRGSDQCVDNSKMLMSKLEDLQVFEYTSPDGRDHGVNVRHRYIDTCKYTVDCCTKQKLTSALFSKKQNLLSLVASCEMRVALNKKLWL